MPHVAALSDDASDFAAARDAYLAVLARDNLQRQSGRTEAARAAYAAALRLDPACPEAHQGLAYLLDGIDDLAAAHHRTLGFAGRVGVRGPAAGAAAA